MERQPLNYKSEQIQQTLKMIAPGTAFRSGIDNVLRAKTGGLIVVGVNKEMEKIVDGGFKINCAFSPASLYELAKMDGAIVLTDDASEILYANVQLIPKNDLPSSETGIRHRTAQRVAKQTGNLVISISQRRNVITLYKGNERYSLKDIGVILTKANQAVQTLEKYRAVLNQSIINLSALEFEEFVTFQDVSQVLHRTEMVLRIKSEIMNYVTELGDEGRLISMQLTELIENTEKEALYLIQDYKKENNVDSQEILTKLQELTPEELLDEQIIVKLLGYKRIANLSEHSLIPRGYRMLNKIPRLPSSIVKNLVNQVGELPTIVKASIEELDDVDGIGETRARKIKEGLNRLQEQALIDRHI